MFCSNCGKDIANDSKFCAHCGTTVASSNFSAEPVLEKTQTKSSNTQANAASTSDVNNAAHSIAAVALNSKSVGLAFLLTAFFGPLGMLYSTITGALLMLILPIPIFVGMFTSISGFVFGLMFFVFYWLICIVWGMIAASSHNKNLLNAVTQGTEFKANASYTPIYIAIGIAIIGSVWVYSENSKPSKPIAEKFAEGFAEGFTSSKEKSLTAPASESHSLKKVPFEELAIPLKNTTLFTKIATECKDVELSNWEHPIKAILIQSGMTLNKVQLCNNSKYPIFFGEFKYDPNLNSTDDYFQPLYKSIFQANGFWPFSIVDTADNTIIHILAKSKDSFSTELEPYTEEK